MTPSLSRGPQKERLETSKVQLKVIWLIIETMEIKEEKLISTDWYLL